MWRLPALLLACAVLLVVCVPTTHALDHDPGKPTADKVFQPHLPVVADEGGWVDLKSAGDSYGSVLFDFKRVISVYFRTYFNVSPLTTLESEAIADYGNQRTDYSAPSGSSTRR